VEVILVISRIGLAAVFLVAAAGKQADRAGSRRSMLEFGLPEGLTTWLVHVLPLAELGVAVTLIPASTARMGAAAALLLLGAFVGGIGVNLARGRAPDCHCFGQLRPGPIGRKTLARNLVLAIPAVLVLWKGAGGLDLGSLTEADKVAFGVGGVLFGLVVVLALMVSNLLRQRGRLLLRLDAVEAPAEPPSGLPIGQQAPDVRLEHFEGEPVMLASLLDGTRPLMLVFANPHCEPCRLLMPEVGRWQSEEAGVAVAVVTEGGRGDNQSWVMDHRLMNVLLQEDREAELAFRVTATPSAVLLSSNGTIASLVAEGIDSIRMLVREAKSVL
jgi:methylamine dehydrogenase accessory protein MauD